MYKNKEDCKKHYERLESVLMKQDKFYELNSKTVTLATLPEVMMEMFFLYQDQQNVLASLVENKTITVEMFFFDITKIHVLWTKDLKEFKKLAIKNDPTLSPDQKVALVSEGASYDTLEGSLHKEMTSKTISSILKKGGGNGLFGFGNQ